MLALAAWSGSGRSPLDLKVEAETPREFYAWMEATLVKQPREVAEEFNEAVAWIVAHAPSKMALNDPRMMDDKFHPICRGLHRRSLREVIMEGYGVANRVMLAGVIQESDKLVMALNHDEQITRLLKEPSRFDRMVAQRSATIAEVKATVERNRRRIAEMEAGHPRHRSNDFVQFLRWRLYIFILP
ncbi:MAG: hypothetical protein V4773_20535 [Verrucomicrobiota bacterium]